MSPQAGIRVAFDGHLSTLDLHMGLETDFKRVSISLCLAAVT